MSLTEGFKAALATWCSGVSIVTTKGEDGLMYGLTVSSLTSVSLDPPLILVCIDNGNRFPSMVANSKRFAVSILDVEQEEASNHFASRGREPSEAFAVPHALTPNDQPVIADSMAWLCCELHDAVVAGDHTIVIGRVVATHAREAAPLLYYRRAYRTVTG